MISNECLKDEDNLDYEEEENEGSQHSLKNGKANALEAQESGEASSFSSDSDTDSDLKIDEDKTEIKFSEVPIHDSGSLIEKLEDADESLWTRALKLAKARPRITMDKEKCLRLRAPIKEPVIVGSAIDIYMDDEEIKIDNPLWHDYYSHYLIGQTPITWKRNLPHDIVMPNLRVFDKWYRQEMKRLGATKSRRSSSSSSQSDVSLSSLNSSKRSIADLAADYLKFPKPGKKDSLGDRRKSVDNSSYSSSGESNNSSRSSSSSDLRRPSPRVVSRERYVRNNNSIRRNSERGSFNRNLPRRFNERNDRRDFRGPHTTRKQPSPSSNASPPYGRSYRFNRTRQSTRNSSKEDSVKEVAENCGRKHNRSPRAKSNSQPSRSRSSSVSSRSPYKKTLRPTETNTDRSPGDQEDDGSSANDRLKALRQRLNMVNDAIAEITASKMHD